jgi:hypothetical protein
MIYKERVSALSKSEWFKKSEWVNTGEWMSITCAWVSQWVRNQKKNRMNESAKYWVWERVLDFDYEVTTWKGRVIEWRGVQGDVCAGGGGCVWVWPLIWPGYLVVRCCVPYLHVNTHIKFSGHKQQKTGAEPTYSLQWGGGGGNPSQGRRAQINLAEREGTYRGGINIRSFNCSSSLICLLLLAHHPSWSPVEY